MTSALVDVRRFSGEGYQPLAAYQTWRVAALRHAVDMEPASLVRMERHTSTDEVFALVSGRAMLILGGNGPGVDTLSTSVLQPGEIHNVHRGAWHAITLTRDAHILIVENDDTGPENSQYCLLDGPTRQEARTLAEQFLDSEPG